MSSLDKVVERMRRNPSQVRYQDLVRVVKRLGYEFSKSSGSHERWHRADPVPRRLVLLRPHGRAGASCHPDDVAKVLEVWDQEVTI